MASVCVVRASFADTSGTDHEDVLGHDLVAQRALELTTAPSISWYPASEREPARYKQPSTHRVSARSWTVGTVAPYARRTESDGDRALGLLLAHDESVQFRDHGLGEHVGACVHTHTHTHTTAHVPRYLARVSRAPSSRRERAGSHRQPAMALAVWRAVAGWQTDLGCRRPRERST